MKPLVVLVLMAQTATRDDPLAGRLAGPAVECIRLPDGVGPDIVDDRTILYRESGRRIWRTGPVGTCPSLRPFNTLVVHVYGRQLCRNDRFHVLPPGTTIPSAQCRFDRFVPYDRR